MGKLIFSKDKRRLYSFGTKEEKYDVKVYRPGLSKKLFPAVFYNVNGKWGYNFSDREWPYVDKYIYPSDIKKYDEGSAIRKCYEARFHYIEECKKIIDPEVLSAIRSFPKKNQFSIERFIWSVGKKYGLQMVMMNPALALIIANALVFPEIENHSPQLMRKLVLKKWRDILEHLGFANSHSLAKILSNIRKRSINLPILRHLLNKAQEDKNIIRRLSFIHTKISLGAIVLLTSEFKDRIENNLLFEVAKNKADINKPKTLFSLKDIERMEYLFFEYEIDFSRKYNFRSINEISRYHDYLIKIMNKVKELEGSSYKPHPYIKNVKNTDLHIEQITEPNELLSESLEMNHCVAGYHERLIKYSDYYFIFKVLSPERLTLLITNDHGIPKISQLRGKNNVDPQPKTRKIIQKWITNCLDIKTLDSNGYKNHQILKSVNSNKIKIDQITKPSKLLEEAREMNYWVTDYHNKMVRNNKDYFIFRVFTSERLTLVINDKHGIPNIARLKAKNGQSPKKESVKLINEWVDDSLNMHGYTKHPFLRPVKNAAFWIKQIIDPAELLAESRDLNNSIFNYHENLLDPQNNLFVFKVLDPERLTLLIDNQLNTPQIIKIKAKNDETPAEDSLKLIKQWINDCKKLQQLGVIKEKV